MKLVSGREWRQLRGIERYRMTCNRVLRRAGRGEKILLKRKEFGPFSIANAACPDSGPHQERYEKKCLSRTLRKGT